jgi:hypothetical protein
MESFGDMESFGELLAVDAQRALEFFLVGLQDVSDGSVDRQELIYNASILAHYAQTSIHASSEMPAPADLTAVFDQFVTNPTMPADAPVMEAAGAQCLLLAGFFEDQMRRRHSIRWYAELGAGFFIRAATHESSRPKARLLTMIARNFEPWRQRHARLSRDLRTQTYLLTLPPSRLI